MAPILYSVVARGPVILCSHTNAEHGNFDEAVRAMLQNIPVDRDAKTTYTSNNYMFHVMVQGGITYICTTEATSGKHQPYAYCSAIQRELSTAEYTSRLQYGKEWDLQANMAPIMANLMTKYSEPERPPDRLSELRAQVDDVKDVMTQNIERVLQRGERLDDLLEKTTELESSANTFMKTSRAVSRKMWWQNMRLKICIGVSVVIALLVIILIILFSTGVLPAKGSSSSTATTTAPAPNQQPSG